MIKTDAVNANLAAMLNGYDYPAILVTVNYQILAVNQHYVESFGEIELEEQPRCYRVSHGYDVPCDQAGENCPLLTAKASGQRERVLHIHQTAKGKEHVDVELIPIHDSAGDIAFFVELLKPVALASPEIAVDNMVGASGAFQELLESLTRVGPTSASVLLLGESGTGKEMAAMAIHQASQRHEKSMVTLECAGLTEALFESELFGYVKGAFTGANYNKQGLVEAAHGGTLFLDEIADVPPSLQLKLLRLIEAGTYRPVGSSETKRSDFRLICATHKNLYSMVEEGTFRQDLFYRINVFPIHLPSLNERSEDIALLAKSILTRIDDAGRHVLTDSAISILRQHRYKGNIRELKNILARAIVLSNTPVIDQHVIGRCLSLDSRFDGLVNPENREAWVDLESQEFRYLQKLLAHCEGDKERAAEIAGISLRSLYRRLEKKLG